MERIELEVSNRDVLGKKVRFLRNQGLTPVHLYGHGIESLALQVDSAKLRRVLAQAGQTQLVNLQLNKEKPRPVLVREIQRHPLTGNLTHVDFYQVSMEEKLTVEVPIVFIGVAPLKSKESMLVQELETLEVECLPANIPSRIEVDISSLAEPGDAIRVKDISVAKDVTILNEPDVVVARVAVQRVEEVVEKVAAAPAPEEAAKTEAVPKAEEEQPKKG